MRFDDFCQHDNDFGEWLKSFVKSSFGEAFESLKVVYDQNTQLELNGR